MSVHAPGGSRRRCSGSSCSARRADRALHPPRARTDRRLSPTPTTTSPSPLADPLPDRRPARAVRDRHRILNSYEQFTIPALTPVFWNLAIIVGLVVGVPRADTESGKLYVYAGSIVVGTLIQLFLRSRGCAGSTAGCGLRSTCATGRAAGLRADAAGHARTRPDQRQRGDRHARRVEADRPATSRRPRSTRPSASTCSRRGCSRSRSRPCSSRRSLGSPRAATWPASAHTVSLGLRQINFLLVPGRGRLGRLAEPIVRLLYQRGAFEPDQTTSSRRARGLLARARVQRDDADAQPRLLQPAVAMDADADRPRRPRAERRALRRPLPVGAWGIRSRSRSRTSPARRCCSSSLRRRVGRLELRPTARSLGSSQSPSAALARGRLRRLARARRALGRSLPRAARLAR